MAVQLSVPTDTCSKCRHLCALDEHNIPRSIYVFRGQAEFVIGGAHCRDGYLHDALPDLSNAAAVRLWNDTY